MSGNKKESTYPWARLYNLESQIVHRKVEGEARPIGRPKNPIPRSQKTLWLTAEELRILELLASALRERFFPAKVSYSQVIGLGIHMMDELILQRSLLDESEDWPSLVEAATREHNEPVS
jgi:hypothetical protein